MWMAILSFIGGPINGLIDAYQTMLKAPTRADYPFRPAELTPGRDRLQITATNNIGECHG